MNVKRIRMLLLFLILVLFHVFLLNSIEEKILQINCFSYETAYRNLRNHTVSAEVLSDFREASDADLMRFSELLAMYFSTECTVTDPALLKKAIPFVEKYRPEEFHRIRDYVYALWSDLERFPVGETVQERAFGLPSGKSANEEPSVTFADSWMQSRTFGGERGHEGCDIMATVNQRGIYPIHSMTDGVVEQIGWLRLGGYRIGIRSSSGAYFYYAHLAEYAKEFAVGERVEAGTFLGYMGDTGYSDIPGTTGNFDVHLHLGIYLNDDEGKEFSVNPYPMLCDLWDSKKR